MHVTNLTVYNIFQDLSTCVLSGVCISPVFYLYLPMSICIYLCLPMFYLYLSVSIGVYLCLLVSTCVYLCPRLPVFTCVYLCPPVSACVYLCLPVFTSVYLCPPVSTCVYLCLLVSTCVHLCLPVSTCVYLCLPVSYPTVGLLVLYKGITPALIRSLPANGALWLAYSVSKPHFDSLLN